MMNSRSRKPDDCCTRRGSISLRRRAVVLGFVWLLAATRMAIAQSPPLPDGDLLKDVPRFNSRSTPSATGDAPKKPGNETAPATAASLGEEWKAVSLWMQEAAKKLSIGETAEPTQNLQERILARLKELASQEGSAAQRASGRTDSEKAGSRRTSRPPQQPQQAAKGVTTAGTGEAAKPWSAKDLASSAQHVWGQLPPVLQDKLRASGRIEFLPQYRRQIEEYYRRLGRDPNR